MRKGGPWVISVSSKLKRGKASTGTRFQCSGAIRIEEEKA